MVWRRGDLQACTICGFPMGCDDTRIAAGPCATAMSEAVATPWVAEIPWAAGVPWASSGALRRTGVNTLVVLEDTPPKRAEAIVQCGSLRLLFGEVGLASERGREDGKCRGGLSGESDMSGFGRQRRRQYSLQVHLYSAKGG